MRKKDFLICYDIANNRRLSKIAKILEQNSMRVQRSVYLYERVSKKELDILIQKILDILDEEFDDLRIYTIKNRGISLGNAIDLNNPLILI